MCKAFKPYLIEKVLDLLEKVLEKSSSFTSSKQWQPCLISNKVL